MLSIIHNHPCYRADVDTSGHTQLLWLENVIPNPRKFAVILMMITTSQIKPFHENFVEIHHVFGSIVSRHTLHWDISSVFVSKAHSREDMFAAILTPYFNWNFLTAFKRKIVQYEYTWLYLTVLEYKSPNFNSDSGFAQLNFKDETHAST